MTLTGSLTYNPETMVSPMILPVPTGCFQLSQSHSGQRLRFTIQHGSTDDQPANYSSVAFWYGQPTYSLQVTDDLNTTDHTRSGDPSNQL